MKFFTAKGYEGKEDGYKSVCIEDKDGLYIEIEEMDDETKWTFISLKNKEGEILESITPEVLVKYLYDRDTTLKTGEY